MGGAGAGGGGYNAPNVARCWAAVTAALLGASLPAYVPDHEFLEQYAPSFAMWDTESMRVEPNDRDEVLALCDELVGRLAAKTSGVAAGVVEAGGAAPPSAAHDDASY